MGQQPFHPMVESRQYSWEGIYTGRKPTLRTCEMICFFLIGLASEEELLAHLEKLKAQDEAKKKL